jgi:predicted enzyme related to lactoylglutathione lyase
MARVTGIGGVFLKARGDAKALAQWYATNLGLEVQAWGGAVLEWSDDHAEDKGATAWHVAKPGDEWFPGPCMINYRVDDLAGVLARLEANGVALTKGPEKHENGQFAWVTDPEGNRVELWEPKAWDEKNKA